jgi:D-alanyl-D-alanine carboxypeptidase
MMPAAALANYIQAPPILFGDGVLFGIKGDNKIYVAEHGRKRHIPTEKVFLALGYSWDDVVWVDPFTGLNHPTGAPMSAPRTVEIAGTHEEAAPAPLLTPKISDLMVRISEEKTIYAGPLFETPVNTYLVADASGAILAGKNIDIVRPIASFAKVMTAYRLLKEGVSLSRASTYDPLKHKTPYHNFRIAAGEQVLNDHLMLAFLPSSLNTPANMMLTAVESDTAKFIVRMNDQAKSWGLAKTVFRDVNGEDERTVSTAKEYLTLYRNASDNVDLRRILGTASYEYNELKDLDGKPRHYDTHSNDLLVRANLPFRIVASKTGYLDEAGAGLVMTIERLTDKKQFIIITMGNPDNTASKFNEPEKIARWAIAQF